MSNEVDLNSEGFERLVSELDHRPQVSAVILSQSLMEALEVDNINFVLRRMPEMEKLLAKKNEVLDFSQCEGLQDMIRKTYTRLQGKGRDDEAQALKKAFEKYFKITET